VKRLAAMTSLIAVFSVSASGFAQRSAQERALAETLFREAKSLVSAGKIAEACPKFAESQRLDPTVGTLMHLATCHEEEGKTATAWVEFSDAAQMAARAKQAERERLAQKSARALEAKLSKLVVKSPPTEGLAISIDGVPLSSASLGVPLPFDPGTHTVEAKAPGKKVHTAQLVVERGPILQTLEIPALADDAPPPAAAVSAPPAPPPPPPPPPSSGGGQRTVGLVLGGVGLAAIGAGAFFGLRASSQADDADTFCTGKLCSDEGLSKHDDASTSALVSTIGFGAGAGLLVLGGYLFFSAPRSTSSAVTVMPSVARDGARLAAEVTW
jgi:hypothetical protein